MFIKDWGDWKGNLRRLIGLGMINFALFFVLGYPLGIEFINSITARQALFQRSRSEDLSISGFVYFLTTEGLGSIPANTFEPYGKVMQALFLAICAVCLFSLLANLYVHNRADLNPYLLAVCTVRALIIPAGSFDYKLPLLVAPLTLLFCSLPDIQDMRKKMRQLF